MGVGIADGRNEHPAQLGYAEPPRWHRRRSARRIAGVLVVIGLIGSGVRWAPWTWRRCTLLREQSRCLAFALAPDQVVREIELNRNTEYHLFQTDPPPPPPVTPTCLERFAASLRTDGAATQLDGSPHFPVFLHERRTPDGERRLVIVTVRFGAMVAIGAGERIGLTAAVIHPGALFSAPVVSRHSAGECYPFSRGRGSDLTPRRLRLYAGQPDPSDPSHFTIGYDINGEAGTIDGWLENHDTVRFAVRDGPAKR
jgi:hypothetical protein